MKPDIDEKKMEKRINFENNDHENWTNPYIPSFLPSIHHPSKMTFTLRKGRSRPSTMPWSSDVSSRVTDLHTYIHPVTKNPGTSGGVPAPGTQKREIPPSMEPHCSWAPLRHGLESTECPERANTRIAGVPYGVNDVIFAS